MRVKILIINDNRVIDLSSISVGVITYTSTIKNMPSTLKFKVSTEVVNKNKIKLDEGMEIRFYAEEIGLFKGYIFQNIRKEEYNEILAYDQLRYLNNKSSFYLKDMKAVDIIKSISAQYKINVGEVDDTGYTIPIMVCDNKTIWNVFSQALKLTEEATNEKYIIFDDFGRLTLKNVKNIAVPLLCTREDKTMLGYNLKTDIDSNTYNKIRILKKDKKTKLYSVLAEKQGDTVDKWGVLQMDKAVDDKINSAQALELAQKLLIGKNRKNFELSVEDMGNINVRSGSMIKVKITDNVENIDSSFYVAECIHSFENNEHTMKLDLVKNIEM